jgi:D-glycero-alpha-D-manno-heptose-7-phosphate kinase
MVITKTPYRVSLFGGGTDFPQWYKDHPGKVISFTINKYCYISARVLPPFFDHKYRIVYSKTEEVNKAENISHPAVREAIKKYAPKTGLEVHHFGDLPARSGVGSSSAFAVGIINCLTHLKKNLLSKDELANSAIDLEQNILAENVGSQDQIACTFGGINEISFDKNQWQIKNIYFNKSIQEDLENRMVLVFTGIARTSSDISTGLISNIQDKNKLLEMSYNLAIEGASVLQQGDNLDYVGELLNQSWEFKKSLNPLATNSKLDQIYTHARNSGAIGGKVLGAGGGGFMLFWLKDNNKNKFIERLDNSLLVVPIKIESTGSELLFDDQFESKE